jgi:heptosyltransferase I
VKILILKPSSLGDVIQALPTLRLLKRYLPQSQLYWWIESALAPLLEGDPDLAGVIPFKRQGWATPGNWVELRRTLRWMRAQRFDWVIDLQGLLRSGAFAWAANGNLLAGLDEPREGARGFYDLIARRPSFHTHAADWYLRVLPLLGVPLDLESSPQPLENSRRAGSPVSWKAELLGGASAQTQYAGASSGLRSSTGPALEFDWLPVRPEAAAAIRSKWPVEQHRWILIQPGARWLNKRWPVEHYAELIRLLSEKYPEARFAVLGADDDRPLGERLAEAGGARCLDLTGKLSLSEMVEWIRTAELMVTNDTGPMHVAAALGKPLVALFGPTEPRRTGPYGQLQNALQLDLPCVPCLKPRCTWVRPFECLRALSPAAAFAAVQRQLPLYSLPPQPRVIQ